MASQTIKQQLLRISSAWPKDLIRPNHQLSQAIAKVADSQPAWASSTSGSMESQEMKDGQALVGALERLMSSRALKQVGLLRRPCHIDIDAMPPIS